MRPRYSSSLVGLATLALVGSTALSAKAQDGPVQAPPPDPPAAQETPGAPPPVAPQPDAPAPAKPAPAQAPPASEPPVESEPAQAPGEVEPGAAPAAQQVPAASIEPEPVPAPPATPPAPVQSEPLPPPVVAQPSAPATWSGQAATPEDSGVSDNEGEKEKPQKSPWRLSLLALEQSVTTETVGIGQDYQSSNPTYDWTLQLLPRYYFINEDDWTYSVLGNFSVAQELTNSDETTERRQLDAGDSVVSLRYDRTLYKSDEGFVTLIRLQAPDVTAPTSRASRNNGRILALAASLSPIQVVPLSSGDYFSSLAILGLARYQHYFTKTEVPTNNQLTQVRTDIDGRPVISDQLSGSAFAKHETRFGFTAELTIHERVALASVFQWRPTWNYQFNDSDVQVCVLTGCADVTNVESPQHYVVNTVFAAEVETQVLDEMSVTVGYVNQANQIGPDGQRRNMFYSPNARFYLTLNAYLSEIFDKQNSGAPPASSITASRGNPFVW